MKKPVDYLWDLFLVMLFVDDAIERDRNALRSASVQEVLFEEKLPQIKREFNSILRKRRIPEEERKRMIYKRLEQMYPDSRQLDYFYTFDELRKQARIEGSECGVRFIEDPRLKEKVRKPLFKKRDKSSMIYLENCPAFT